MNKIILAAVVLFSFVLPVFSQKEECGTKMREKNKDNNKNFKSVQDDRRRFIVPVVFHVLYNKKNLKKDPDEYVTDEKILGLLETLQNDFLATNADISNVPDEFKDKIGNPNIKFVLADTPPVGGTTKGIIRRETSTKKFKKGGRKMFDESPIIDPTKNLNVYVCNLYVNGFVPPEENTPKTDGVIISYKVARKGLRTLTHEAGHWFYLYHIFEGECDDEEGDLVSDTPTQEEHDWECEDNLYLNCEKKAGMFMNFMDYSSCRNFFTKEQVKRMRQHIFEFRASLQFEKP